jgi:hypothetical protein
MVNIHAGLALAFRGAERTAFDSPSVRIFLSEMSPGYRPWILRSGNGVLYLSIYAILHGPVRFGDY